MKIFGDYHTHSKYSKFNHGKNTIFEMAKAAEELGLKEIAITDHAPCHVFGILKSNIKKAHAEVEEANKKLNIKVLFGLECNLLGTNGETDLPKKYKDLLDVRALGFHKFGIGSIKCLFGFSLANLFSKQSKRREKNTDAYISAIKTNEFDFITHPKEYIDINVKRFAEACEKYNTFIEINNRHLKFSDDDMKTMINETNVKFILSSDSHKISSVGNVEKSLHVVKKFNIPEDRVVNLNKTAVFKSHK